MRLGISLAITQPNVSGSGGLVKTWVRFVTAEGSNMVDNDGNDMGYYIWI